MSHPAVKLKKLQLPQEPTSSNGRRPSNPSSHGDSLGVPEQPGFNPHRRRSTYKPGANNATLVAAVSLRRMTRHSLHALPQEPPAKVRYENTYKIAPDPGTNFLPHQAEAQVKSLLEQYLTPDMVYDASSAGHLAETIAEAVKNEVKTLNVPRYKLISTVALGQCGSQGVQAASRCLWNENTDSYTSVTHKTKSMFVIVTIYGVYFE